jgi:hypothetical protein
MDYIIIRYGQDLTLPIDAGDETATSASIFIGEPGKVFKLTKTIPLSLGKGVFKRLPPDPFHQALGHLPVGIDLWHDGGEGPHAVVAFQAGNIEVDGHSPAMAWQVTDKQGFLLMDDHSACWPT